MPDKQMQLFILPYAGGSKDSFKKLAQFIDERIEVVTVEYSGRGTRSREPLAATIDDLLTDAMRYAAARRNENIPFSILGYSMGGIFAYEFLSQNVLKGQNIHTFICAEISPEERAAEFAQIDNPTDDLIIDRARKLGGVDERIIQNKRFYDIYIRPMISDFKLLHSYKFVKRNEKLRTNITFFYCEKDTPRSSLTGWRKMVDGEMDYYEYGKDHFFINHYYREMAQVINQKLSFLLR